MERETKKIVTISSICLFMLSMFLMFLTMSSSLSASPSSLTLDPDEGPPETAVVVSGVGFTPGTCYRVYFDKDGDEKYDFGEPYRTVMADGGFKTALTVPSVAPGPYYIRADISPYSPPAVASAQFNVTSVWEKLLGIQDEIADKPKIFEATYFTENMGFNGTFYINITSTENFQVKAVYVTYIDPDDTGYLETYEWDNTIYLVEKIFFWYPIAAKNSYINITSALFTGKELLSWMGLDLPPAGRGYASIFISLLNHGDGDETLFVMVIVESAQTAEVTVNIVVPCGV